MQSARFEAAIRGTRLPVGRRNYTQAKRLIPATHLPAHPSGQTQPNRQPDGTDRRSPGALTCFTLGGVPNNRGRGPARGMAQPHPSDALDPAQTPPRSPLSTNPTTAPARPNGQSLARRAARLIPGIGTQQHRARDCPWLGAPTSKRCTYSQPSNSPPFPLHQPNHSASPPKRAGARPARCALDSGLWCPATQGARLPRAGHMQRVKDS